MIELALVPIVLGLVALIAWQQQQFGLREKEWARERQLLISRIQHPKVVQPPLSWMAAPEEVEPEMVPVSPVSDDIDLVGTVQDYGTAD